MDSAVVRPSAPSRSPQRLDRLPPLRFAAREPVPVPRRAPEPHERAGHERAAPERRRQLVGRGGLADIQSRGNEHELRCHSPRREPPYRRGRRIETGAGAHPLVRRRGRAVHRHLNAVERKGLQPVGGGIVDMAAVGFELEGDAARRRGSRRYPSNAGLRAVRRHRRRRRECRNPAIRRARSSAAARSQLVRPRAVGAGLLAAREAARAAAVGELPGKEKGRAVLLYRTPCICVVTDSGAGPNIIR